METNIDKGGPRPGRRAVLGAMGLGVAALGAASAHAAAQPAAGEATPVRPESSGRPARTLLAAKAGQTLTALGLGTFMTFDARPGDDRADLCEVFRRPASRCWNEAQDGRAHGGDSRLLRYRSNGLVSGQGRPVPRAMRAAQAALQARLRA